MNIFHLKKYIELSFLRFYNDSEATTRTFIEWAEGKKMVFTYTCYFSTADILII